MDHHFQKELIDEITKYGIHFVHFVDITPLPDEQTKGFPVAVLFGVALSKDYLDRVAKRPDYVEQMKTNKTIKEDEFYLTEIKVNSIADLMESFIVSKGFRAYSQSEENIEKTGYYDNDNKRTPLPQKTIARIAGIGWIGKHNLFVTPEYGSGFCMCSVLTDAPLKPKQRDSMVSKCGSCTICTDICTINAIKGKNWECGMERETIIDVFSCTTCFQCVVQCPWTKRYTKS